HSLGEQGNGDAAADRALGGAQGRASGGDDRRGQGVPGRGLGAGRADPPGAAGPGIGGVGRSRFGRRPRRRVRRPGRGAEGVTGPHVASPEEIRSGQVTDVYFLRGEEVLRAEEENPPVVAEIRASSLPADWGWAVLGGLEEALWLLEGRGTETGRGLEVQAISEGTVFYPEEPVVTLVGPYLDFGILETALLGLVCQATGIATAAARCRLAAGP